MGGGGGGGGSAQSFEVVLTLELKFNNIEGGGAK